MSDPVDLAARVTAGTLAFLIIGAFYLYDHLQRRLRSRWG